MLPLPYLYGLSSGTSCRAWAVPRLACRAVSLDSDQADGGVGCRDCGVHDPPGTRPQSTRSTCGSMSSTWASGWALCLLVMIEYTQTGAKELGAQSDGYRESAKSWADVLRDCAC